MKHKVRLLTVLVFAMTLLAVPLSSYAAVGVFEGGVTNGVDANGTSFVNGWVTGGDFVNPSLTYTAGDVWYENYTIGAQNWFSWYEITAYTDPLTFTTGPDYYLYSNLSDGAGTTALYTEYEVDDIYSTNREMANSVTGFLDSYYEYDDQSGNVGAYYEEITNYIDPSGTRNYRYEKRIDIDDGNYNDDWTYNGWNWYDAGTADGREGFDFYNYVEGTRQNEDYDYNSLTGYFDIDRDSYLDTDLDGNWTDNYYTQFDEYFDVYSGEYENQSRMWDYDGLTTGGNAAYTNNYRFENRYSGEYENYVDMRMDTDGDGSYDDYSNWADFGAYRTYSYDEFYISDYPYQDSANRLYDSINRVMTYDYSEVYTGGNYTYSNSWYRWDADGDGSYTDDYYWSVSNTTEYGEIDRSISLYDYVSTYANRYSYSYWTDTATGDFDETEQTWIDNDGDLDFNDYMDKGAKYTYNYSEFDSYEGYSESESTIWDPAGDYDAVTGTFGTRQYTYSESWIGGDNYSESSYAKDTDNDGTIETGGSNDLWLYSDTQYYADELYTQNYSRAAEDTANARGAYSDAWVDSWTYAGSGEYERNARVTNLAGQIRTSEGYYADDGYSWNSTETRTWGVSRTFAENWSYAAGDFGVWAVIELDTDANTAYNNQDDYELYASSWDETYAWGLTGDDLAGGRYVGSRTSENGTTTFSQEFAYTSSGDGWYYYSYDPITTNEVDQQLYYQSGYLAAGMSPWTGTVRYEGLIAAPYTWVEYMYVSDANAWYLVEYEV